MAPRQETSEAIPVQPRLYKSDLGETAVQEQKLCKQCADDKGIHGVHPTCSLRLNQTWECSQQGGQQRAGP